ncbi:MAG: hypothetical protein IKW00_05775 [Clostridia bacterium]|nr:hypothetical protein [Clostridia bacterium]
MKTIVALITALLLIVSTSFAFAEEYETLSIDELKQIRDEMIVKLNAVNTALGQKIRTNELTDSTHDGSLGKIKDLFPDIAFAKFIREKTGKISIEQTVTQAELDEISSFSIMYKTDYGSIADLTGIGYLRNLRSFTLNNTNIYIGTEFPEEFYTLTQLVYLKVCGWNITSLSDSLGNLVKLETLIINWTNIDSLPESIGNLSNLNYIDISNTEIEALPESIGNLSDLRTLDISNTKIKELPDSIWNLKLDTLGMKGLPIE